MYYNAVKPNDSTNYVRGKYKIILKTAYIHPTD